MLRGLNPVALAQILAPYIWDYTGTRTLTAGSYSSIRSIQDVVGSLSVASGVTGNKDVTIAVTDYTKCLLLPIREMTGLAGNGFGAGPKFFVLTAGGGGSIQINSSPILASNTVLRFVVAANGSGGDIDVYYGVRIVELY